MPSDHDITIVVPSIPPRSHLLARAIMSVGAQTHPAAAISVAIDNNHEGSGPTRTRAMRAVQTEWLGYLDDDDQMMENHLEVLVEHQRETDADVVWPWFRVLDGQDPFPMHQGRQWDPLSPHIFPITALVRTEVALQAEFPKHTENGWGGDDFAFWCSLSELGAKFSHVNEVTWLWSHAPPGHHNTSGMPDRW
jgi:Glycosyl transferase family 2